MPVSTFEVAGIKHHREAFVSAKIVQGDLLKLEPEPTNAYDRNAVKVMKGKNHIGYVPMAYSSAIAESLSNKDKIKIEVISAWHGGCVVSAALEDVEVSADLPEPQI